MRNCNNSYTRQLCRIALLPIFLLLTLSSCGSNKQIEPKITYTPPPYQIETLKSPFPPLSTTEQHSDWGKELYVGSRLAKDQDLFGAITAFKRSRIFLEGSHPQRLNQLEFDILLAYYLGGKYDAVCENFEKSPIQASKDHFPPYNELLTLLYDSYMKRKETSRQEALRVRIYQSSEALGKKMDLYTAYMNGNLANTPQDFQALYSQLKKSPERAGFYNAILPGAGYLYVGQKQTALTSFILNALFIAAACEFYSHKQIAAGIITTGFELGWYLGGIKGAHDAAKQYNTTLYNRLAYDKMVEGRVFPILTFEYGF